MTIGSPTPTPTPAPASAPLPGAPSGSGASTASGPGSAGSGGSDRPRSTRAQRRVHRNRGLDTAALRRKRLLWFAIASPLLLAMSVFSLKFFSMPVIEPFSTHAYHQQNYDRAISRLGPLKPMNWFESYLVPYNEGTARLQQGDLDGAETQLRGALDEWNAAGDINAPLHAECKIRTNLAITLERRADQLQDDAAKVELYDEALAFLQPCLSGGGSAEDNEDSEQTESAGERSEEKREEAGGEPADGEPGEGGSGEDEPGNGRGPDEDPAMNDPDSTEDPSPAPTSGEPTEEPRDPREEELEERNREANDDGEESGEPESTVRPW